MTSKKEKLLKSWMCQNMDFIFPKEGQQKQPPNDSQDDDNHHNYHLQSYSERINLLRNRWDGATRNILQSKSPEIYPSNTLLKDNNKSSPIINMDTCHNNTPKEVLRIYFENLLQMHTEDGRAYHTLCHLEEMFGYIDLLLDNACFDDRKINPPTTSQNTIQEEDWMEMLNSIIVLSTFFHDCIYNPKSGTNEEDSAKYFLSFLQDFQKSLFNNYSVFDTEHCKEKGIGCFWKGSMVVYDFILATKSHCIPDNMKIDCINNSSNSTIDFDILKLEHLKIFLDADMSVLGKQRIAYEHYASLIREEYCHVPHDIYCDKRADILESFIGSVVEPKAIESESEAITTGKQPTSGKTIFLSHAMKEALEERALNNIRREIETLRKHRIPGTKLM